MEILYCVNAHRADFVRLWLICSIDPENILRDFNFGISEKIDV